MVDTLLGLFTLKDQIRTGWTLRGVTDPESVADHSWGTAILCLAYADEAGVDRNIAVEIAILHDVAETVTGDVPTRVATMADPALRVKKQENERAAMEEILADAPDALRSRVHERWHEYEQRTTPEALFVRDMNLIDMCMQAVRYETDGRVTDPNGHGAVRVDAQDAERADQAARRVPSTAAGEEDTSEYPGLSEFFATTQPRLSTPLGRRLYQELLARYHAVPQVAARGRTPGSSADEFPL